MASADFRISVGLCSHYKTGRLIDLLDYVGFAKLIQLWEWATVNRPDGVLTGMTDADIEFAVGWPGEKGYFVLALVDIGWLDVMEEGTYCLHEWTKYNSWVAESVIRSDMGRMGKLASDYPEIYEKYLALGINAISKEDYDAEVRAYKMRQAGKPKAAAQECGILHKTAQVVRSVIQGVSNSGDPTAPDPSPKQIDIDQDRLTSTVPLSVEQPTNEPRVIRTSDAPAPVSSLVSHCLDGLATATTSKDETTEKPILVSLNQKNKDQKPVKAAPEVDTSNEVKVLLVPGEVEEVHPSQIPEGMTVEEVRSIRQDIRNEPGFRGLPLFLQQAKLRTTPFAIASDRKREQEVAAEAPQSAPERLQMIVETSLPYQPSRPQTLPSPEDERAIVREGRNFSKLLHSTKELYHAFPGYRPSKNEDEWLITICQSIGNSAYTIIKEALRWVQIKKLQVQNARGFLSAWIQRVSAERGLALATCA